MVRRAVFLACLGLMLVAAPQAQAADTMGQLRGPTSGGLYCEYGGTLIQTASPGNFYAAPYDGVITSWTTENSFPTTFKVARLGTGNTYTVLGSDGPRTGASSTTPATYPVRFPVRQGDTIGVNIAVANYLCAFGQDGEIWGVDDANPGAGESGFFDEVAQGRVYVQAKIEHDRDGDGYGDETQDGCPTNASTQGPCPLPTTLGQTVTPFSGGQSCVTSTRVVTASPEVISSAPHDGVVTSWSHQTQANVGSGTIRLKMLRPLGGADYRTVGESDPQTPVPSSLNTYPTRLPVNEGDKIGLAINGTVPCSQFTAPGNYGRVAQDLPVGSSATFSDSSGNLDIAAVLEADADGDGYGDTTQDLCPTDPSTQAQCPVIQPPDDGECDAARKKLAKAKAKLKKLKKKDAAAKKLKAAKQKVKKAKASVKKDC